MSDQPSTSSGTPKKVVDSTEKEEIVQLWKHLDETLESKAKSLNLTSLNVKSILHHLIKYPNTIHVLMGLGGDSDLPNMRLTRSHRKPTDGSASPSEKMSILFESLSGNEPKTFLDLNFDDNDEFDDDYVEDEEEVDDEEEEEGEAVDQYDPIEESDDVLDSINEGNNLGNLNNASLHKDMDKIEHMDNSYDRQQQQSVEKEFRSYVNPEYQEFINAVINEEDDKVPIDDETDDEDYDVQIDDEDMVLDVDEWYETRHDRATEIPRYEVERLMMDTILAEKEIPAEAIPKEAIVNQKPDKQEPEVLRKKTLKEKDAETVERLKQSANPSQSCSLISGRPVTFKNSEIAQLKIQLEQHVQLLTQFVVTCYCDKNLYHVKNEAQIMINELDNNYQQFGPRSLYNIPNLGPSVQSCHDIIQMEPIDKKLVNWAVNTDEHLGPALRPEAVVVLSRSLAIKFPNLLPKIQPTKIEYQISFTKSEDLMLALGLLQFAHLPRKPEPLFPLDRYTAIHQHCLPSRPAAKIRNHMKTMRMVHENSSPMHMIIMQAEQGICQLEFPSQPIIMIEGSIKYWPQEFQPNWYKMFIDFFKLSECGNKIMPINETFGSLVITPSKIDKTLDEERYIRLGTIGENEQPVLMEKQHVAHLVNQLFPEKEISPSKRRKLAKPMKMTREEGRSADDVDIITDDGATTMFPPPPTPGKRAPSEIGELSNFGYSTMMEEEYREETNTTRIPMTPKHSGNEEEDSKESTSNSRIWSNRVDFGDFNEQEEMNRKSVMSIRSEADSISSMTPRVATKRHLNFDSETESYDYLTSGKSQMMAKRKKRTRIEKETMGKLGLNNEPYIQSQKCNIAKRMMIDVKNRLFMHQQKWKKLESILSNSTLSEDKKIEKIVQLFETRMPEIMHLLLIFAPVSVLPAHVLKDPRRHSNLSAIQMLLDIDAYITAARMKAPTTRQIFKFISKLGIESSTSLEMAQKMHQLLGHERPLWEKIEKNFYSLAFKDKEVKAEDFEVIDLTNGKELPDCNGIETIDDIDAALDYKKRAIDRGGRPNLFVKSGQLMAINKNGLVPVEVKEHKWTRKDDMNLLMKYNLAVSENPEFQIEQMPEMLKGKLSFGPKSICKRIEYLLSML